MVDAISDIFQNLDKAPVLMEVKLHALCLQTVKPILAFSLFTTGADDKAFYKDDFFFSVSVASHVENDV